jgi:phage gp46-like protein
MRGAGQHAGFADTSVSGTRIVELQRQKKCQQNALRADSPAKRYFCTVQRSAVFQRLVIRFPKREST